jgi:protein SERAC1
VEGQAILWITGEAGRGKSVMAKHLINHLRASSNSDATEQLCYFFFKDGLQNQDNASAAISAILHQICSSQPRLGKHIFTRLSRLGRQGFKSLSLSCSVLATILKDPTAKDMIWILDGLDECESKSRHELLGVLDVLFTARHTSAGARLKVVLLSRPDKNIEQALRFPDEIGSASGWTPKAFGRFRIAAERNLHDISSVIVQFLRHKTSDAPHNTSVPLSAMISRLADDLEKGADRTFLWVSLVVSLIEERASDESSAARLQSVVSGASLDKVYEEVMSGRQLALKARKAVMAVLAAVKPLSLREMCVALEVHQDHFHVGDTPANMLDQMSSPADLGKRVEFSSRSRMRGNSSLTRGLSTSPSVSSNSTGPSTPYERGAFAMKSGGEPYYSTPSSTAVSSLEDLESHLHKSFATHLKQLCGSIISIRGDGVFLVHQTAREFLLARPGHVDYAAVDAWIPSSREDPLVRRQQQLSWVDTLSAREKSLSQTRAQVQSTAGMAVKQNAAWQHSIRLEEADRMLLRACVDYLKLFQFDPDHAQNTAWTSQKVARYLEATRDDPARAFFHYAAAHWIDHYRLVRDDMDFSYDYLLNPDSAYFGIWIIVHSSWRAKGEHHSGTLEGIPMRGNTSPRGVDGTNKAGGRQRAVEIRRAREVIAGTSDEAEDWVAGFSKGNGWLDAKKNEKVETVLYHFGLGFGDELELFDEECLAGRKWRTKDSDDISAAMVFKRAYEDGDDGEEPDDEEIPDRIRHARQRRRAEVMEKFGEMTNPLSPMLSHVEPFNTGSFFTNSYLGRRRRP